MDILGIYSLVAQSLDGALEDIELDGDNCHYQKIMMMESLRACLKNKNCTKRMFYFPFS